jgi:hypothetical protein
MKINKTELYNDYLSKLEEALTSDNFENIDYILEYMYSSGIPENILEELDDILHEATLYSEIKETEYKDQALELI